MESWQAEEREGRVEQICSGTHSPRKPLCSPTHLSHLPPKEKGGTDRSPSQMNKPSAFHGGP